MWQIDGWRRLAASPVGPAMTAPFTTELERARDHRRDGAAHVVTDHPVVRDVLASIVEGSPAAVAVFRRDGSVGYRNPAWNKLAGGEPATIDGDPDPVALALEGQASPSQERTIRRADGTLARVLLNVVPIIDDGGRPVGAIAHGEALDRAAAGTLREAFLGVLSHELRTPITSIYGGSRLLLNEDLSAESRYQVLEAIATEAEELHRRVEDFLAVARVERGRAVPIREPVPVMRVIGDVTATEQRRAPETRFVVRAEADLPPVVGDEIQVRQAMRNLVSSAREISPPGRAVVITARQAGDWVEVRINDRGRNLEGELLDDASGDVFSLAYRHPGIGGRVPRSGFGLYVARALVEANGGRVWRQRRRGGGTETGFALPVYGDPEDGSRG